MEIEFKVHRSERKREPFNISENLELGRFDPKILDSNTILHKS